MRQYAESSIFSNAKNADGSCIVVEVKSKSNPNKMYRVDLTNGRCSCPAWIHAKGGIRKPCKHLRELGFVEMPTITEIQEPNKSQGQMATVKNYEGAM